MTKDNDKWAKRWDQILLACTERRRSTKQAQTDGIRPGVSYTHQLPNGITLIAEVSPCVFMFPGHPLQLCVTLKQHDKKLEGDAYALDHSHTFESATDEDVSRLLATVRTMPCKRCLAVAFDPKTIDTNREGYCESCFLVDLQARLDKEIAAKKRRLAQRDKRMKAKGMNFRVFARAELDDGEYFFIEWYAALRPTRKAVHTFLKQQRSAAILKNYDVTPI